MQKFIKVLLGFLTMIGLPITMYLQYQILKRVDASELMWFLFWVNIPVIALAVILREILQDIFNTTK